MKHDPVSQRKRLLWRLGSILAVTLLFGGVQAREELQFPKDRNRPIPAAEFARLVEEFSEEGGYFRSDNFVSNETSYLHVLDRLKELGARGGAYIGVGPEQNFTYIAKIQPRIAFIVDIRRQAVIQHLMFKAIFHHADTRLEFLSILFSKPLSGTAAPSADAPLEEIVQHIAQIPASPEAYSRNLSRIWKTITREYLIPLQSSDRGMLEYVYSVFRDGNLHLQYRSGGYGYRSGNYGFPASYRWSYFPTFQDLIFETDLSGTLGNFLADRRDYDFVRSLQESNRIIPVVGDFGGPKALAAVGAYLKKNGYTVTAFYTSNVEQYLFSEGGFDDFAQNVARLPITDRSLFIRAYPNQRTRHPAQTGNHRLTTLLQKIAVFLDDYRDGAYPDYWTLVRTHYISPRSP